MTIARGKWIVSCAGGCRVKYDTRAAARAGKTGEAWCGVNPHKITHEDDPAEQASMRHIVSAALLESDHE